MIPQWGEQVYADPAAHGAKRLIWGSDIFSRYKFYKEQTAWKALARRFMGGRLEEPNWSSSNDDLVWGDTASKTKYLIV